VPTVRPVTGSNATGPLEIPICGDTDAELLNPDQP